MTFFFLKGIETAGGVMTTIIKRNATIPAKQTQTFTIYSHNQSTDILTTLIPFYQAIPEKQTGALTTYSDKQFAVDIKVFEGERSMTKDNHLLGCFTLSDIPSASPSMPEIEITFDIDANGILKVSATDKTSGQENKITITNDKDRLSKYEIEYMIADAEKYKKEDETQHERISAKNSLESFCFNMKAKLTDKINARDKKKMIDAIEETIEWLEINEVKAILFLSLFYLFSFSLL